jgi:hypothetical protein
MQEIIGAFMAYQLSVSYLTAKKEDFYPQYFLILFQDRCVQTLYLAKDHNLQPLLLAGLRATVQKSQ